MGQQTGGRRGQVVHLAGPLADHGRAYPLFLQLCDRVRGLAPNASGRRLPSERELSRTLGVARVTVRKALERLSHEGLIERRQGDGTFFSDAEPRGSDGSRRAG
jgi:DNA-binding GntR family transcriptional regulator